MRLAKKGILLSHPFNRLGERRCQGRLLHRPPPQELMAVQSSDRPNLLILMADQLTARALRAYGGTVARTPHLDSLAAQGVVFASFYCNSPLCAPSRFSFLAGQLPSKIGAYDNAAEFAAAVPTFAHYVRSAGYQTALAGKMHFCGPDQLHGFEERLTTDIYPADFGWTPDWTRFEERPGWYHTMDSVTQAGPCTRTNQVDFDDEVVFAARQKLFDLARSRDRRPFCLVASMTHPHDPYVVPEAYWNRYRDDEIDMPRVGDLAGREDPSFNPAPSRHRSQPRFPYGDAGASGTPRVLRGGVICRRSDRGPSEHVEGGPLRRQHDRHGVGGSRRHARRARPLVQNELLRARLPDPAHRARPRDDSHPGGSLNRRRSWMCCPLWRRLPTAARPPAYAAPIGGRSLLPALQGWPRTGRSHR